MIPCAHAAGGCSPQFHLNSDLPKIASLFTSYSTLFYETAASHKPHKSVCGYHKPFLLYLEDTHELDRIIFSCAH